ncbi:unnamed protein product [Angiostrongylus costaricensis]|uniref:LAM_G_DOMAIN domain-containing protein n=1 Tax=Angiostrongylus costaricensis TaxID=334426 RepID=A0A0R3PUA2_ANGCS|nr:unnamed protein product [Angiostrongylus costaricensis]
MQERRIRYDINGPSETRKRHSFNAVDDIGEKLFVGACDSRDGGVRVLVSTILAMNIDSFEQLTTRIRLLLLKKSGSIAALTRFPVYQPTSSYDEKEVETLYMDLENFYREDHTFFEVIIGNLNAKIGPRRNLKNGTLVHTDYNGTTRVTGSLSFS